MEASEISDYYRSGMIQSHTDDIHQNNMQLIRVLTDHEDILDILKNQMRGELAYQDKEGERYMIQVDKPMFVLLDQNNKPLVRNNPKTGKPEFCPNDEAINEMISILKMCGLNPVAPMTTIDENEIRADLLEMESKLAVLLTVKRKEWGLSAAQYPIIVGKMKVLIKDARYRSKDGIVLKALRTITSRIEQAQEKERRMTFGERIKSPFS
jgi:hypothetical protein